MRIIVTGLLFLFEVCLLAQPNTSQFKWYDHTISIEERSKALVEAMTLEEKIGQLVNSAPAIDRLGVPKYDWWNECLHGVGRTGRAFGIIPYGLYYGSDPGGNRRLGNSDYYYRYSFRDPAADMQPPKTPDIIGGVMNGIAGYFEQDSLYTEEVRYTVSEYWTPMVAYTMWLESELMTTAVNLP
jgi:hypothetical protein